MNNSNHEAKIRCDLIGHSGTAKRTSVRPIVAVVYPCMGKTYFAKSVHNVRCFDADFGHFRSHVMGDDRQWTELAYIRPRIRDIQSHGWFDAFRATREYESLLDYYTAEYIKFVNQLSRMDTDIILVNSPDVMGEIPDVEYWLVTPRTIQWWKREMDKREYDMKSAHAPVYKLDKHRAFVATMDQSVIDSWQTIGRLTCVDCVYCIDDRITWQRELLSHISEGVDE